MLNDGRVISPLSQPAPPPSLLLVEAEERAVPLAASLRDRFRVTMAFSVADSLQQIERRRPAFVLSDLQLPDGSALATCRAAKRLEIPAAVLVTTDTPELVPPALDAGCDGVLLKPYAPNLLYARLGRLSRVRNEELRQRSARQRAKAAHLVQRSATLHAGTNQHWPNTHCPHCHHAGVTSFEYVSYRRAWYACPACSQVWIAKRLEDL